MSQHVSDAVPDNLSDTSPYAEEAGNFIQMMSDLDSRFNLDFTYESILRLESFIAENFDANGHSGEQLPTSVGAYVGETIIRTLGGHWAPGGKPEIIGLGTLASTNPIEKARQRFKEGPQASLSWYYQTLRRQHYLTTGETEPGDSPGAHPGRKQPVGLLDRLFGFLLGGS